MAVEKKSSYFSSLRTKLMLTAMFVFIVIILLFTYLGLIHVVSANVPGLIDAGGLFVLAAVIGIIGWYTRKKSQLL